MIIYSIKELLNNNIMVISFVGIAYALDFLTGISKALYKKNVSSNKLRKSIVKGISYFAYIIMGSCLQLLFPFAHLTLINKNYDVFIYFSCLYIIITEFISVTENTKQFAKGIPFINKFLELKKEELENSEINE